MADHSAPNRPRISTWVGASRDRARQTFAWRVWERMLEIEFVDRGVALAGKAFTSFFPLVIVVAAFMPKRIRSSILESMTNVLGIRGHALETVRQAFASTDDVRRATGILGLLLTLFFASAFTTALQRLYLRTWRRAPHRKGGVYTLGVAWLPAMLVSMAVLGGWRGLWGNAGITGGFGLVALISVLLTSAMWWFTAWFMLLGQVRPRVLIPTGLVTGVAMFCYATVAAIWMPGLVSRNDTQFGIFGVALALVTWLSGAAICVLAGACAGAVLAEDSGPVGVLIRGQEPGLLVAGAPPQLSPPVMAPRLRDAFGPTAQEDEPE